MFKLGVNFDEISDSLNVAVDVMNELDVTNGELRTLDGKNFCFWNKKDIETVKEILKKNSITPIAVASPIFKWYVSENDLDVKHDSFGFDARLDDNTKKNIIDTVLRNADYLSISIIRIFSGLGKVDDPISVFLSDPILTYALEEADKYGIDLYLENEPVCRISTEQQLTELFSRNTHPRLKLWLDVANLVQLDEEVDKTFLETVGAYVGYVHVKDFIVENGSPKYVPVGQGLVEYSAILARIAKYVPNSNNIIVTIETHASDDNKIEYSKQSIRVVKKLLRSL